MSFTDAISARIFELLLIKKMNPDQLATNAGINESTIRSILNKSNKYPTMRTIHYICIGFGISLSDFFKSDLFEESNLIDD